MIEKTKDYEQVLLLCSTSNISRIQVMLEVAKTNNLTPIEDILLANVLSTLPNPLPNPSNSKDIYCFLPSYYYKKRNIDKFKPYIDPFKEKISQTGRILRTHDFIMNVRTSMLPDLEKLSLKSKVFKKCVLVYSCWLGYLEQDEQYKQFIDRITELGIDVIYLHTSGHMDGYTFREVLDILKPKIATIPLHTTDKYKIKEYTDKYIILEDMETLEINEKGECKIIKDIETRRRNPAHYITLDRLLGYNIKDKYLKAPLEEDINNPTIQMEIIKHLYYEELFNSIDIITDQQVITEILTNRVWQRPNLRLYEGKIQNIKITKEHNGQVMDIELEDSKTKLLYEIKGYLFISNKDIELYKSKVIEPNKDNIIAIVNLVKGYPKLVCFMKSYSNTDIESTYNIYKRYLEELPTIWKENYSSIKNVPNNIIKITDSNIKKYANNEMARNYIVNGVMRNINNRQDTITNEEIISLVEEYKARYYVIEKLKTRFNQYSKELNKEPDKLVMVQFFDLVYKRNLYKCSTYSELKDLIKKLYEVQGGVKYAE